MATRLLVALATLRLASGCSDFLMPFNQFTLSGRTMDLGTDGLNNTILSNPRGQHFASPAPLAHEGAAWTSTYGTVGFGFGDFGSRTHISDIVETVLGEGMNEAGMTCGSLALIHSSYQPLSHRKPNLHMLLVPKWALENFGNVSALRDGLDAVNVFGSDQVSGEHFVCRDATGASLVMEWLDGELQTYLDLNDDGKTGYGIMTNEPPFPWQLENVEHMKWKMKLARSAVAQPGAWYPDERFLRIHLIKNLGVSPLYADTDSLQFAVSLTSQVMNSVWVPMGEQHGTDTGESSGEVSQTGDHTLWGVVRDHEAKTMYYRCAGNPSLRRIRLEDFDLSPGAPRQKLAVSNGNWFDDTSRFIVTE